MTKTIVTFLALGAVAVASFPVPAEEDPDIHIGITTARLHDEFGVVVHNEEFQGFQSITRPRASGFDGSAIALELNVPIRHWLSFDIVTYSAAESNGFESGWIPDPPIMTPPGGPSVPAFLTVYTRSKTRATIVSVSFIRDMAQQVSLYGRVGAAFTETDFSIAADTLTPPFGRFSESDTVPWVGVGLRYRFFRNATATAEVGLGSSEFRSMRVGLGWTF